MKSAEKKERPARQSAGLLRALLAALALACAGAWMKFGDQHEERAALAKKIERQNELRRALSRAGKSMEGLAEAYAESKRRQAGPKEAAEAAAEIKASCEVLGKAAQRAQNPSEEALASRLCADLDAWAQEAQEDWGRMSQEGSAALGIEASGRRTRREFSMALDAVSERMEKILAESESASLAQKEEDQIFAALCFALLAGLCSAIFWRWQKIAEKPLESLAGKYEFLTGALSMLPTPAFILDESGAVKAWNEACERATGMAAKDMVGSKSHASAWRGPGGMVTLADVALEAGRRQEKSLVPLRGQPGAHLEGSSVQQLVNRYAGQSGLSSASADDDLVFRAEGPLTGPGGHWSFTARPLFDRSGKCIGSIETLFDQTGARKAQDALLEAKRLADEMAKAKSNFMATMSHEMRTPLNAIVAYCGLLSSDKRLPEDLKTKAQRSAQASKMLVALINDVLDFAKIVEHDALTLENAPCNLDETLDEAFSCVLPKLASRRLAACVRIAADVPEFCDSDSARLSQLLINLLSNAAKFTASGHVTASVWKYEGRLFFSVKDTGVGIERENIGKIFEPFAQADASVTRKYGGTGLGLSISKRIAQAFGSDLEVESVPLRGSEFSFSIPESNARPFDWPRMDYYVHPDCEGLLKDSLRGLLPPGRLHAAAGGQKDFLESSALILDQKSLQAMGQRAADELAGRVRCVFVAKCEEEESAARARGMECMMQPVSRLQLRMLASNRRPAAAPGKLRGKILIVDDVDFNRDIASETCEGLGLLCETAGNGQEALEKFKAASGGFGAILMDIRMPMMDGMTASRKMLQMSRSLGLPEPNIILFSANFDSVARSGDLECVKGHLPKPFDPRMLGRMLTGFFPADEEGAPGDSGREPGAGPAAEFWARAPKGMDLKAARRCIGDSGELFAKGLEKLGQLCSRAAESGPDRELAHKLRSAAGMMGMLDLAAACAACDDDPQRLAELWPQARERALACLAQLGDGPAREASGAARHGSAGVSMEEKRESARMALDALSKGKSEAIDILTAGALGNMEEFAGARELAADFEFMQARDWMESRMRALGWLDEKSGEKGETHG